MKVDIQLSCNSYIEESLASSRTKAGSRGGEVPDREDAFCDWVLRMSGMFSACERLKLQTTRNVLAKWILFVGTSPPPLSTWVDVSVIHMIITSQASPSILGPGN